MSSPQKVAVVTGASSGIGAELVRRLLVEGWKVAVVARRTQMMRELCNGSDPSSFLICTADLSDNSQSTRAVNQIRQWLSDYCDGRLDLLVNNAGASSGTGALELEQLDTFEWTMRLNLISSFIFLTGLKPALLRSSDRFKNEPSVVNIGSICGDSVISLVPLYCIAKAGLHHLSRLAAVELAPNQIRVNTIAPATVETGFHKALGWSEEKVRDYYANAGRMHPIGRAGKPKEIAEMVLFLANPKQSGWITGQTLTMDGGRMQLSAGFTPKKLTIPSKI